MATRAVAIRRRQVPRAFTRAFRPRSKPKFTLPLAVVAGFTPFALQVYGGFKFAGIQGALSNATKITGYDPNNKAWNMQNFKESGAPQMLAGILVHKIAGRLGINRALARAGVPFIRI